MIIRIVLPLIAIIVAISCTSAPLVTHTVYRYSIAGPTSDFRPGDTVPLIWKGTPQLVQAPPSGEKARVCVALVGPYSDVTALKASHTPANTCPVNVRGTILASDIAVIDLVIGAPVDQSLVLPRTLAPGYYDLISVMAYGTAAADTGNSSSAAGIVHVVAAP